MYWQMGWMLQAGVGYFQIFAAFCTGLSLAADTVEIFVVPYILPSAEVELCIEDSEKGWLGEFVSAQIRFTTLNDMIFQETLLLLASH